MAKKPFCFAPGFKKCIPRRLCYILLTEHFSIVENSFSSLKWKRKSHGEDPYAECDTFDLCDKFHMPEWLNHLPPDGRDSQAFNSADFDEELRRDQH